MTEIHQKAMRKKKKSPHKCTDYFPITAFQQTVPDLIPAISNVKKDS